MSDYLRDRVELLVIFSSNPIRKGYKSRKGSNQSTFIKSVCTCTLMKCGRGATWIQEIERK